MSRRLHLTFNCEGSTLAGTLDTAPLTTGLLLVSGGNELRSGAFRGQARLAQTIAKRGFPVFRYDRRGVGDSEGENLGFTQSEPDIRAAIEAIKAETGASGMKDMGKVMGELKARHGTQLDMGRASGWVKESLS